MLPEPKNASEIDDEMEAACIVPPAWYVEEVHRDGGMGINLPEKYWRRYLRLYEKKKHTAPYTPWSREAETWLMRRARKNGK